MTNNEAITVLQLILKTLKPCLNLPISMKHCNALQIFGLFFIECNKVYKLAYSLAVTSRSFFCPIYKVKPKAEFCGLFCILKQRLPAGFLLLYFSSNVTF